MATTTTDLVIVHACWASGRVCVWGESGRLFEEAGEVPGGAEGAEGVPRHPFAVAPAGVPGEAVEIEISVPAAGGRPAPSASLALELGRDTRVDPERHALAAFVVPAVAVELGRTGAVLERLLDRLGEGAGEGMDLSPTVEWFAVAARLAHHLLARQRFVPMLCQDGSGELTAAWRPWLADEETARRVSALVGAVPPAARAATGDDAWTVTEEVLGALVDDACRRVLRREEMQDTIEGIDAVADQQVAWLSGLLLDAGEVSASATGRPELIRRVRRWIGGLEDRGESTSWRLGLRLNEPIDTDLPDTLTQPGAGVGWSVSFFLQSQDDESVVVEASDVWLLTRDTAVIEGLTLESPQELLLGELGRASRYWKRLESALRETEPIEVMLGTEQAYEFLREVRPVLVEQGITVEAPAWWDSPAGRLGARLRVSGDPLDALGEGVGSATSAGEARLGLGALVNYHWEIAIGQTTLTLNEFEKFASKAAPLVRLGGRWVEVRPEDVEHAIKFIQENPGGKMELSEALRLAYAADPKQTGIPVLGMEAEGWVASIFGGGAGEKLSLPQLETPASFKGTLRPYQQRGLSWLSFMERIGFGACLADDMGLGKTIQLLALMAYEREVAPEGERVAPTLLIVPMSVVGNWVKEIQRFTPQLVAMVHHGPERRVGDEFVGGALASDIVVTTYALAHRDRELIERVPWGRVVLDEAQFVKNPATKQSQAVRAFGVGRRVALTGTPVENRLSELWSIMDFLNPGYLGSAGQFRKRFAVPIERHRDPVRSQQLRGLVQPFVLRRVKSDPTVVADLPDKLESKEYAHLTPEQAQLYESCVQRMLGEVERTEGIHRRGVVLAGLIKLKQICNHPSQMLKDHDFRSHAPADPARSGKTVRVLEMLHEVLAEGDKALVFTQFRQMGHLLGSMLRHELGREILFLHGGTSQGQRQQMIDRFQEDAEAPILVLSLKAGGVGLNLTAATHVFHFDRWWNPAVENQATDRAYRIGQTRTVQVHKFVVRGTLEERIDEMIESKTELAENIIGHGERWLTELDTDQLRDLLALRADAVGDDE